MKKKRASLSRRDFPAAAKIVAILRENPQPHKTIKRILQETREILHHAQSDGASSTNIISLWTWFIDQLLVNIWNFVHTPEPNANCGSLIAVGGYGRNELHPSSDIDLMILLDEKASNNIDNTFTESSKRFLYILWDIGLDIGHSVRTVAECKEAAVDLTVVTNLMEARLLFGSMALLQQMQAAIGPDQIWPADQYFHAKLQEQRVRHIRFGETAYKLEPNIKESPGGLRDLHMIAWATMRYFNATSLEELVQHEFLTRNEYQTLIRCRNFLWRIRNGLHFLAGHREDRLLFEYQRELATEFGYSDKHGNLAVEQLMKRYYRTVKELGLLNDILLQHFEEVFLAQKDNTSVEINRRFNAINGYVDVVDNDVFNRQPFALLEVFYILQDFPELKGIRANTIRLIHNSLNLITPEFRRDIACRSLFITFFRNGAGLTHIMRKMNDYGVLGAYFPAFGRIVGLMQHDLFHIYTIDVHTLFVIRNLRRLSVDQFRDEHPLASKLLARLFKPERLYLAALLHDIAKGRGGNHSEKGERISIQFCRLHDLSEYDTKLVAWLVYRHLIMSWTAQKMDISDPEVIAEFSRTVGDQEHLDNLYLLTMADMRGTSPKVWNDWKNKLLLQLYHATSRYLRRTDIESDRNEERLVNLQQALSSSLVPAHVSDENFQRYWSLFDSDYFLRYEVDTLKWHIKTLANVSVLELPVVAVRYAKNSGCTEVLVFTPDLANLLVRTTGGFDRLNLNIVDARLHTTQMGFALHNYLVLDQNDNAVCTDIEQKEIEEALKDQLLMPRKGRDPLKATLSRALKQFPIPTQVNFLEIRQGQYTVLEVIAQDRPGLLYQIAEVFEKCDIKLHNAKVATYGARIEDIFFVSDLGNKPITDSQQQDSIRQNIIDRLDSNQDA
ncbi:MAG: [protein-PII] uridylyltransferase [Gammaproteobacteria bacterium]|nr:[protein-PII] uridylyltransferase [Gammaproteobacteria bacterium]